MKQQTRSVFTTSSVIAFTPKVQTKASAATRALAILIITLVSPIYVINAIISIIKANPVLMGIKERDALGRTVLVHQFSHGLCRRLALLNDVASGRLSFCGVPLTHSLAKPQQRAILRDYKTTPGFFSLYDLHKSSGLAIADGNALLIKQLNAGFIQRVGLLLKSLVCLCLFTLHLKALKSASNISLFGLSITNSTMGEAVDWVTKPSTQTMPRQQQIPKVGFFINVNSINLGFENPAFMSNLQQADALFADGSGMRLATRHLGYQLKDNNNGTDMLPHLCLRCIARQKSVFLLGAKPGVAMKAAINLKKAYPQLKIVGIEHGYNAQDETEATIERINNSGCDVLLVAMGSPIQESWILKHKSALRCQTALAVGGLFDFYADEVSRAPLWLRELGMEWLWRLVQEPKTKFYRYVVGNPVFLFRLYILGLATKGAK